ncbi:MAG: glycosyl transferase family 1 [Ignavibacteriae bacterium]|nr:MAG: glycosyl transferase family 1 [Ignavibacteriota bacterium]
MFKVLVIAYYYPPLGLSGVQRTLKFTKYLKDFGWEPTVLTTGKIGYFAYDESLLKEAEDAGVTIVRTEAFDPNSLLKSKGEVKMPSNFWMKVLSRISKTFFIPDNKIRWSKKAAEDARRLLSEKKFDAIYISVPPFSAITPILQIKEIFHIPLFVDYRDAWIDNQFSFYPTPYHKYKNKKLESNALRRVDGIITVNRLIKENLLKNYQFLKFDSVDIIRHGYDLQDFEDIQPVVRDTNKMVIAYSGSFYEDITPYYFFKGFKKLMQENPDIASNIELKFIGHFKREYKNLIKKLKIERFVRLTGYLEHKQSVREILSSDVLWVMLPNEEKMKVVTPGKLFEYFATRKPVIASLPDGAAKINAEEYKAAFITKPDDIAEIKETLLKVHKLFLENNLPKPDEEFIENLNRTNQTEQLAKIFQFYLKAE